MEKTESLHEIITARWLELPEELKDIYLSSQFETEINEIGTYYKLSSAQIEVVKNEVSFVLLILEPLTKLSENISHNASVDMVTASAVVSELELLLLNGVKEMLEEIGSDPEFISVRNDTKRAVVQTAVNNGGSLPEAPKTVPEKLDLGPATMKKGWETEKEETRSATLGTVPGASNDLKERLELRPKNVMKQSFTESKPEEPDEEDDGPKPLTRTQILQSLTAKRTMASDIASIHKGSDTNTHT